MQNKANMQDLFLNQARKEHIPVTVFLTNGFQLKGMVTGFDSYVVLLETDGKQQLIYKHALSTIIPAKPIEMHFADKGNETCPNPTQESQLI